MRAASTARCGPTRRRPGHLRCGRPESGRAGMADCSPPSSWVASYRVVVGGLPDPGTVMMSWVIATRAPRTSATVSTARMSARMTRRLPVVARCAGGRRGHSCGRGAGARSRRRWRPTPGGSMIAARRYGWMSFRLECPDRRLWTASLRLWIGRVSRRDQDHGPGTAAGQPLEERWPSMWTCGSRCPRVRGLPGAGRDVNLGRSAGSAAAVESYVGADGRSAMVSGLP